MIKEVKMPEISEDADGGTIVEILVQEGDTIEAEQSVIAVESDKASVEVPSTEGGTIKEIKVAEGDEVKVGEIILTLEANGEDGGDEDKTDEEVADDDEGKDDQAQEETEKEEAEGKEDEDDEESSDEEVANAENKKNEKPKKDEGADADKSKKQQSESAADVPAPPSVRRMAREMGVDIRKVTGTGPGERITADDVKAFAGGDQEGTSQEESKPAKTSSSKPLPDFSKWGDIKKEKMSSIRKATVSSMSDAWQTIPHVTQFDKADITKLEEYTDKYKAKVEKAGGKLTVTAILMKVVVAALRAYPKFNASIDPDNDEVILKNYYHLGIAADTERGLLVPVIRDVDKKSVINLSTELPEIAQKAREGKLSGDEMKGGTFTISNLGGIGGTNFTPIVYKPQVAILGVSRTQTEPVYIDGAFQPRSILPLSLSYDHRLIDGAEAARFLRFICQSLEDPFVMLMEG